MNDLLAVLAQTNAALEERNQELDQFAKVWEVVSVCHLRQVKAQLGSPGQSEGVSSR